MLYAIIPRSESSDLLEKRLRSQVESSQVQACFVEAPSIYFVHSYYGIGNLQASLGIGSGLHDEHVEGFIIPISETDNHGVYGFANEEVWSWVRSMRGKNVRV